MLLLLLLLLLILLSQQLLMLLLPLIANAATITSATMAINATPIDVSALATVVANHIISNYLS